MSMTPEQKAAAVLRRAINDPLLLDYIIERACIRWADGLSDSLFDAVLCRYKRLNEKPERDSNGEIILKPKTNWREELF